MDNMLKMKGRWKFQIINPDGSIDREVEADNGITIVGKNDLLDAYFRNQTQPANWYIGLIDSTGYTAVAEADEMSSHAGWAEFTNYDEAARPEWAPGAAASKSITNATARDFTISAGGGTIKGAFIVSNSTKSGITGILWATVIPASALVVVEAQVVKAIYTVST